eukprot:CAMPEP_0204419358 /NCGR_PEP_ID=MMETSP0470-20130426/30832_1 /ASSEMBLY_ACC=CAM_ASM_000385 /TAXON_ID=2969 /ORGANISM="Oxyrrhis marina" /LENGTH=73 /DNA_ID=CAMNT_0051416187 /DNA_START=90 /DNA_END=308 /DNA_ORIENTATION=-
MAKPKLNSASLRGATLRTEQNSIDLAQFTPASTQTGHMSSPNIFPSPCPNGEHHFQQDTDTHRLRVTTSSCGV